MKIDLEVSAASLFTEIKQMIEESRKRAYVAVNVELVFLYWNIGKNIQHFLIKDGRADYGKQVIPSLSARLRTEYGNGFSKRNIANMIKFYECFPDPDILQTLSAKLSWSHFVELLSLKNSLQREFYYTLCINENWNVRLLRDRINSMLFERSALSKKPDLTIKHDLETLRSNNEMSVELAFKDTYLLDFLGLSDTFSENDLEQAILKQLQLFILEMGSDFAFLARQKRITIGSDTYHLDLLFFHRKLRRLIAIDLKLGRFKHSHKSQMEVYLKWLAKNETNPNENMPIGLILCADKNEELVQLLEIGKDGIHVAEYYTELPPIDLLKRKMYQAINEAKHLLETKKKE